MTQIERITKMEQNLDEVTDAVNSLSVALQKYQNVKEQFSELSKYYGSEEWMNDFNDDAGKKLPKDLKRGVLSEDAVYDIICEEKRLLCEMLELATKNLKDGE